MEATTTSRAGGPKWAVTLPLPLAWGVAAAAMAHSWSSDPYDPTLTGTAAYGHNGEGALSMGLTLSFVELLVLVVALRPWSYGRASWWRPLVALVVFVPWTMLWLILTMHAGGIIAIHALWLIATDLALVVLTLVTAALHGASRGEGEAANGRSRDV